MKLSERHTLVIFLVMAALVISDLMPAQTSRPIVAQNYCTGTAAPGTLFAMVAIVPPGTGGGPLVAIPPMRCVQLDPTVFSVNAAGMLTVSFPVPTFAHSVQLAGPNPDGSYTVPSLPNPGETVSVLVNGQFLVAGVDFTMSGTSINFLTPNRAPRPGDTIVVLYQH